MCVDSEWELMSFFNFALGVVCLLAFPHSFLGVGFCRGCGVLCGVCACGDCR